VEFNEQEISAIRKRYPNHGREVISEVPSAGIHDMLDRIEELTEKVKVCNEALDEIAYGAPWGGPQAIHIKFMRKLAHDTLEKNGDGRD
jgi:hypothetical protein